MFRVLDVEQIFCLVSTFRPFSSTFTSFFSFLNDTRNCLLNFFFYFQKRATIAFNMDASRRNFLEFHIKQNRSIAEKKFVRPDRKFVIPKCALEKQLAEQNVQPSRAVSCFNIIKKSISDCNFYPANIFIGSSLL